MSESQERHWLRRELSRNSLDWHSSLFKCRLRTLSACECLEATWPRQQLVTLLLRCIKHLS